MSDKSILQAPTNPICAAHGRRVVVVTHHPDPRYVGMTVHVFERGGSIDLGPCVPCPDDTDGDGNCGKRLCPICGDLGLDA